MCGLLFEPGFSDGAIVSERTGSANWTVIAKGVAAHVGRDFRQGRNAIVAMANYIQQVNRLNSSTDSTINVGSISGGGPVNIVPDHTLCRINARVKTEAAYEYVNKVIHDLAKEACGNGIALQVQLDSYRAPKRLTHPTKVMLDDLVQCAKEEGYELLFHATAGVCDGNTLAEVGLPVIDTLGVIGGELHTPKEYVETESFRLRCRLVTRFLLQIAQDPAGFIKKLGS
jgi:glutamate carboxypeptidase